MRSTPALKFWGPQYLFFPFVSLLACTMSPVSYLICAATSYLRMCLSTAPEFVNKTVNGEPGAALQVAGAIAAQMVWFAFVAAMVSLVFPMQSQVGFLVGLG